MNATQQLTRHFTLHELTRSATAIRLHIDNTPDAQQTENLRALCQHVLEPLRRRFGAIRITSGYRCPQLNKAVGGVRHSYHLKGQAADIHVSNKEQAQRMVDFLKQHTPCREALIERRNHNGTLWIHVSYTEEHPGKPQTTQACGQS